MRIGVTISRTWDDYKAIEDALLKELWANSEERATLIHGASQMDWFVAGVAYVLGMQSEAHPADWDKYRRPTGRNPAGVIRNQEMVTSGADVWLAFIAPCVDPRCSRPKPHGSHGASDCANVAERAGIPVRRYEP